MKGDFSRNTFDPTKHYSGVLMQQGRVQVDADWNEQNAINQYRTLTEAGDVIGPCAVPQVGGGFAIGVTSNSSDLTISPGRIYVDGILCQLEAPTTYLTQPDYPNPSYITTSPVTGLPILTLDPKTYVALIYLDVWQRHITALDDPHIREVALGGPDTTTRVKIVWQVKIQPLALPPAAQSSMQQYTTALQNALQTLQQLESAPNPDPQQIAYYKQYIAELKIYINTFLQNTMTCSSQFPEWDNLIATMSSTGTLNAQAQPVDSTSNPCSIPPGAGYQLLENQLYRVEVHFGSDAQGGPTFKWSRDNGSVVMAIQQIDSSGNITVHDLGPDDILGFATVNGQLPWVEVVDDWSELNGQPGQLVQVKSVDPTTNTITVEAIPAILTAIAAIGQSRHPKLRRWDQVGPSATATGVIATPGNWQDLEGGIQVQFSQGTYRTGDYWLIPARTATGAIEWPQNTSANPPTPIPQLPLSIQHHYCRLGLLHQVQNDLTTTLISAGQDCRLSFPPSASPTAMHILSTNWRNDDYFTTDRLFNEGGLHIAVDATPHAFSGELSSIAARVIVTLESASFGVGATTAVQQIPGVAPTEAPPTFEKAEGAEETTGHEDPARSRKKRRGQPSAEGAEEVAGPGGPAGSGPGNGLVDASGSGGGGGQSPAVSLNYNLNGFSDSYVDYNTGSNIIRWVWSTIQNKATLDQALVSIMNSLQRPPYMCLTVRGHAMWSDQGNQRIYLDGQAFGRSGPGDLRADNLTPRTALSFPSGAGVRASDFESWFYLVPPPLQVIKVNFVSINATSGQVTPSSAGPISLPPVPQYPNEVHFNSKEQINAIDITFSLPINAANIGQLPIIQVVSSGIIAGFQGEVVKSSSEEMPPMPPRPGEARPPRTEAALPPRPAVGGPPIVAGGGGGGGGPVIVQGTIQPLPNPDGTVTVLRFAITDTRFPNGFTPSFYNLAAAGGGLMPDGTTPPAITSVAVAGSSISLALDGVYNFMQGTNFLLPFNVPPQP